MLLLDQVVEGDRRRAIEPGERVEVLPFLDLVHVMNEGVAFGFLGDGGSGDRPRSSRRRRCSSSSPGSCATRTRPWSWLAIGLLAGGAIGNLADRLFRDAVVDFIDLPAWPSFNLADIAITLGAAVLVLAAFAEPERPAEEAPGDA